MDFLEDMDADERQREGSCSSDGSTASDNDESGSKTSSSPKVDEENGVDLDQKRRKAIIEREEGHVRRVRVALIFATLACAVAVSVSVYHMGRKAEHHRFDSEVSYCYMIMIYMLSSPNVDSHQTVVLFLLVRLFHSRFDRPHPMGKQLQLRFDETAKFAYYVYCKDIECHLSKSNYT